MTMVDTHILLYVTVVLLILITLRSVFLKRNALQSNSVLAKTLQQLEVARAEIDKLKETEKKFHDFTTDLQQAEIATKMQQSRKMYHQPADELHPPEKYQYVHSLAQKGINASDIATILTISPHEADQLVNLANLSRNT
ncbi:MAG: hypothetical protein QNJ17_06940 [Desulfocapsaceae bacterium]|nr:hypothetical protein [Desulfocapsaceae bacterium]